MYVVVISIGANRKLNLSIRRQRRMGIRDRPFGSVQHADALSSLFNELLVQKLSSTPAAQQQGTVEAARQQLMAASFGSMEHLRAMANLIAEGVVQKLGGAPARQQLQQQMAAAPPGSVQRLLAFTDLVAEGLAQSMGGTLATWQQRVRRQQGSSAGSAAVRGPEGTPASVSGQPAPTARMVPTMASLASMTGIWRWFVGQAPGSRIGGKSVQELEASGKPWRSGRLAHSNFSDIRKALRAVAARAAALTQQHGRDVRDGGAAAALDAEWAEYRSGLLYTSPSPRD